MTSGYLVDILRHYFIFVHGMAAYKRGRSSKSLRPSKRRRIYRKSRKVAKRRVYRTKRNVRGASYTRLFPDRRMMTHHWTSTDSISVTSANLTTFAPYVKLSNVWDPCSGASGFANVVSSMYNVMKTQYNHFTVLGAKVTCIIRPRSEMNIAYSNGQVAIKTEQAGDYDITGVSGGSAYGAVSHIPVRFGILIDDDFSIAAVNYAEIVGAKHHSYKDVVLQSSNRWRVTLKQYFSAKRFFGLGRIDDSYGALTDQVPQKNAYAVCYAQALDATTTPLVGLFSMTWDVSFRVLWTQPRDYRYGQGVAVPTT